MSQLVAHAEHELALLQHGADEQENGRDEMQAAISENLLGIVRAFADGGHSGGPASYAIRLLPRLLSYEPLTPLTGADDEWVVHEMPDGARMEQNRRCGRVFREHGVVYALDVVVFKDRHGSTFTGWDSARRISLPCIPPESRATRWRRLSRWSARLRGQLRP